LRVFVAHLRKINDKITVCLLEVLSLLVNGENITSIQNWLLISDLSYTSA